MKENQLTQFILEQSKDLIWTINHDFKLIYANKSYQNFVKTVTGKEYKLHESALIDGFGAVNIEKWKAYYKKALNGESFEVEEHCFIPSSNEIQYGQIMFEPLLGEDSKTIAATCRLKDITQIVKQRFEAKQLMDTSLDVFCSIDEKGNFVYVSLASTNHWGYPPEEIIGKPYIDFVLEEDISKTIVISTDILSGKVIKSFFNRYKKKDGSIAYNLWSARWDDTAKLIYCVARDGQKKIEQEEKIALSEQRFKALVQDGYDLITIADFEGNYFYVSPSSTAITGFTPEECVGRNALEFIHPDDTERALATLAKLTPKTKIILKPFRTKNKNNEWRWVETVLTNMLDNPAVKGIVANTRDITERIEQEEKILQSELRFKALIQEGSELIGIIDTDGNYRYVSPTSTTVLGIAPEEFIDKSAFDFIHVDDVEKILVSLQKIQVEKRVTVEPFRFKNSKNEWRWIETVLTNMLDNPAINGIVSNARDITYKIEEQQRLKLLESVITNTNDVILITEAEPFDEPGNRIIYVNEAFTKMTGYSAEEVIGKTPRILQGPNSDKQALAELGRKMRNWEPCELTTINYKKSGEEFWINFVLTPVANEKGWYTHWIAIERDVTEQKTKELENELLAKISRNFNAENDYIRAAKELCKTISEFGEFDCVELWATNIEKTHMHLLNHYVQNTEDENFYESSHETMVIKYSESLAGKVWAERKQILWENLENNKKFSRRDEAKKIGLKSMLGIPLVFNDEVVGVLKIGSKKVTDQLSKYSLLFKRLEDYVGAELNRKKLEHDLSHLFDSIPDILCLTDFDGRFLRINKEGCKLLGYSEEEILYHNFNEFVHPDDKVASNTELASNGHGISSQQFENRYITKTGKIIWLSWFCNSSVEEGLVYSTAKNITEEKKLRELNRVTRSLAKIGSWEFDIVNQKIYWSDEVHLMYESDPKTFVPEFKSLLNFYREDFTQLILSDVQKLIATGEPFAHEVVLITSKNKELWVRSIGHAEFVNGSCTRVFGSFQDINDRKESEIRLISLADNLPGVVFQYLIYPDGSNNLKYITKASKDVWGYTSEEVLENNQLVWNRIVAGGEIEKFKTSIAEAVESKTKWTGRWKYMMPSGEIKIHLGYGSPSFLADGTILFNSVILDITKEAANEELLEQVTEMAKIGSFEIDLTKNIPYWSVMAHKILETDPIHFVPDMENNINFYREDFLSIVQSTFKACVEKGTPCDFEAVVITANKNEKWVRIIANAEIVNGKTNKLYGSLQDINTQKLAALELEKSLKELQDYKFSLDQSAIIAFTDEKGVITYVNDNFCSISGYNRNELIGKTHQLITSYYHPKEFFIDLWKTISSGKVWRGEVKNKAKDGSYYWVDTTIVPFLDAKNKPFKFLAIRFEITSRKLAEEVKINLQTTIENSLNEIYIFDAETFKFSYVNKGALLNLGYSEKEMKSLTPMDIKPSYSAVLFKQLVSPLINNEKEKIIFFTNHKRKNGSLYPVEVHLQIVTEDNSKSFLAIILDITERKAAEENILLANERFEKATEATNDTIWDWDIVKQTYYRSKSIEKIFGESASKSFGEVDFWKDSFHPEDLALIKSSVNDAIINPLCNRWELEYRVYNELGKILYVIDRGIIIRNSDGKAIRMVGAMTDVSEQKQMTLELKELNKSLQQQTVELQRSNEELEQFAFVASHDLQEPLRMISSFMDLLQRKYGDLIDEKGHQYIHFARDGAKRMKQIILDLLDYSRSSRPTEGKELVDLNDVLAEFKQLRRKLISEKSAKIISKNLPTLNTYKAAITQILHCLLDNAIKYSVKQTSPIVEINVLENDTEWEFSIKDNGIGIDAQFYEKIFIIFQRLHNKDEYTGTGIGLSIAKKHVEFLGGRIWLDSKQGEGTTFYFTISKTK